MANTTNYNWETPDDTDLVKDGAAAIRTLGSSVDTTTKALNPSTTLGDIEYRSATANTNTRLGIGTTGQVLTVAGGVPTWATSDDANAIQNALLTTTGDTIYASGASTPARLGIGTTGQVLTVAGGVPSWATPAGGGGKVLQVVQATTATQVVVASTTMTDSGLSASITPSSATSRILIIATQGSEISRQASDSGAQYRIMRDATQIWTTGTSSYNWWYLPGTTATQLTRELFQTISYIDSPSSTSSITYKTQGAAYQSTNSGKITFQSGGGQTSTIILMEIGA